MIRVVFRMETLDLCLKKLFTLSSIGEHYLKVIQMLSVSYFMDIVSPHSLLFKKCDKSLVTCQAILIKPYFSFLFTFFYLKYPCLKVD